MKNYLTKILLLIPTLILMQFTVLFAQNDEDEMDRDEQICDYSFMQNLQIKKNNSIPFERMYHISNQGNANKVQASAFKSVDFFGPYNCAARTRALMVDGSDSLLMFAGGTSGGLFRSTDKGLNWTPVNDQTIGLNVTCITQNPFNPDLIYYGTGEQKNRKISNSGSGLYRSTDHGQTFHQLPATDTSSFKLMNSVKHSLIDSNTIYVATTKDGFYRSTDGGNSFQLIFNNLKSLTDIECFPNGSVMVTANTDGIYLSSTGDSGTFVKSTIGLPDTGFTRIEVAYCDSFPNVVYSVFADTAPSFASGLVGVYKSSDGGITWDSITNPENVGYYCFADYMLSIIVRPNDSNYVICGGAKAACSINGGKSWGKVKYARVDQHALVFDKYNKNLFFTGTDQGITKFDLNPRPVNPTSIIFGYNISQIWAGSYFPSGKNCLFGAQDNFFLINQNSDSMFNQMATYGIVGCFTQVNQQDSNITYISGINAKILRCDSSYNTDPDYHLVLNELDTNMDQVVDDETWHTNPIEMNLLDGNQLYLATRDRIWRTTNGATNWIPITNSYQASSQKPFAIGISNAVYPKIYCGGEGGFFCRIDDGYNATPGQEVDLSASVPPDIIPNGLIACIAVQPNNDDVLYAVINDNFDTVPRVWKITGATTSNPLWTDISSNLEKNVNVNWIEMDPANPDSVLFIGTDYGLYSTVDAGTTWTRETALPLITIRQMRLRKSDRMLFIFTFGRGVWLGQLPPLGNPLAVNELTENNSVSVFPNPSGGKFNIEISNADVKITGYTITDMKGVIIDEKKNIPNGIKQMQLIDLAQQPQSVYMLNIQTNKGVLNKKLIKL